MIRPVLIASLCVAALDCHATTAEEHEPTIFYDKSVQEVLSAFNAHNTTKVFAPSRIADKHIYGRFDVKQPRSIIGFLADRYRLRICQNVPDKHSITLVEGSCPASTR